MRLPYGRYSITKLILRRPANSLQGFKCSSVLLFPGACMTWNMWYNYPCCSRPLCISRCIRSVKRSRSWPPSWSRPWMTACWVVASSQRPAHPCCHPADRNSKVRRYQSFPAKVLGQTQVKYQNSESILYVSADVLFLGGRCNGSVCLQTRSAPAEGVRGLSRQGSACRARWQIESRNLQKHQDIPKNLCDDSIISMTVD